MPNGEVPQPVGGEHHSAVAAEDGVADSVVASSTSDAVVSSEDSQSFGDAAPATNAAEVDGESVIMVAHISINAVEAGKSLSH